MRRTTLFAAIIAATQITGCATVIRGTTQPVQFTTDPAGAEIQLSNGMRCTSPCVLELKRSRNYTATASADCYYETSGTLASEVSGKGIGGTAGNIIIGGGIGVIVDAATGAMKDLKPNPLHIELNEMKNCMPDPDKIAKSKCNHIQADGTVVPCGEGA